MGSRIGEEALHAGVVPAVALATHAAGDAAQGEEAPVLGTRVLAPPVGVVDEPLDVLATVEGLLEGGEDQGGVDAGADAPAHHPAAEEVERILLVFLMMVDVVNNPSSRLGLLQKP